MIIGLIYLLFVGSSHAQRNGGNVDTNIRSSTVPKPVQDVETDNSSNIKDTLKLAMCETTYGDKGVCVDNHWCNQLPGDVGIDLAAYYGPDCSSPEACCRRDRVVLSNIAFASKGKVNRTCGQYNPDGLGLANQYEGRKDANFGEFPWNVVIFSIMHNGDNSYVGGGSLIHPSVALTTINLVEPYLTLTVRAGEWDTISDGEILPHQDRDVKEVLFHEDYKLDRPNTYVNDIALLFLMEPMDLSVPHIGVVCLPLPIDEPVPEMRCLSSSWGKGAFLSEKNDIALLQRTEVLIVNRRTCKDEWMDEDTDVQPPIVVDSSSMCGTIGHEHDIRTGDPLICPIQNRRNIYVQTGMVSRVYNGNKNPPTLFVNVAKFRNWIDDNVARRGYDTSTYSYAV